jgi:hypothetical protein
MGRKYQHVMVGVAVEISDRNVCRRVLVSDHAQAGWIEIVVLEALPSPRLGL